MKYYIGIDPAFRMNGFALAIINAQNKSISYIQFKGGFIAFYRWLVAEAPSPERCIICVENSNLTNKTFDMSPKGKGQKWNSVTLGRVLKSEGIAQADTRTNQDKRDGAKLAVISYKRPYLAK